MTSSREASQPGGAIWLLTRGGCGDAAVDIGRKTWTRVFTGRFWYASHAVLLKLVDFEAA